MLQYFPIGTTEKLGKESFGMKKKYIGTVFFSLLLLLLFLPVFFFVIYYGSNVDYNEMHKIVTVEGNRVLFLCAIVGAVVLGILYSFLRKLPTTPHTITVFTAVTVAVCVLFLYDQCQYFQMYSILRRLGLRNGGQFGTLDLRRRRTGI